MPQIMLLLFCLSAASFAGADDVRSDDENVMQSSCHITPYFDDLQPMPAFANSNNLRRRTGDASFVEGQPMILKGRLLDSSCVPVAGAVINIWQANADGVYEFGYGDPSVGYDRLDNSFGAGTAVTDNLGNFHFITIFPGMHHERAPHINIRVQHADFSPLITQMFFDDHPKNASDMVFAGIAARTDKKYFTAKLVSSKENVDFLTYVFDIILEGRSKYLTY